jgi:5-methylcytosine-specific restriction protein A
LGHSTLKEKDAVRHRNRPPWHNWYGLQRWKNVRAIFLKQHRLCKFCLEQGVIIPAQVVDHIIPHHGDHVLFWSPDNLQSLCKPCHDSSKQQLEDKGYVNDIAADGWMADPNAPVNVAERRMKKYQEE